MTDKNSSPSCNLAVDCILSHAYVQCCCISLCDLYLLAFWISILKISKLLQNSLHRVIDITSFEKHLESFLDRTPNFCQILVIFRSKNMYLKESLTRSSTVI